MKPLLLSFAFITAAAFGQSQDLAKVEIKSEKVEGTVWMLTGEGGNIGVSAGEDGIVLVDDQFAGLSDKIKAAILNIKQGPIRFVINTHHHQDHTDGNEKMAEAGAVIVAHENVRKRLSKEQIIKFFNKQLPPYPKTALPI